MKTFQIDIERLHEIACTIREFGDPSELTWRELYEINTSNGGFKDGELEKAAAQLLNIPQTATYGYSVHQIGADTVTLQDVEEAGNYDPTDPTDAHLTAPLEAYRAWLQTV